MFVGLLQNQYHPGIDALAGSIEAILIQGDVAIVPFVIAEICIARADGGGARWGLSFTQ